MVAAGSSGGKGATTSTTDVDDEEYFEPSKRERERDNYWKWTAIRILIKFNFFKKKMGMNNQMK